ncbi:MAG: class II glutamine amidotransferase [Acidimicrobiales bacterium]
MCEILAAWSPEPLSFAEVLPAAADLERCGIAGFGWGVAWLAHGPSGLPEVRVARGMGRLGDEAAAVARLAEASSTSFLVHVRRPSSLSTISPEDTQPFGDAGDHAWCHNGHLERADELRHRWAGRLRGQADSEVGWQHFRDRRAAGAGVAEALRDVDELFGGNVNLGYLGADGTLAVYGRNPSNHMWRFRRGDVELASTGLHSDDDTLFAWLFPDATERRRVPDGTAVTVGTGAAESAA